MLMAWLFYVTESPPPPYSRLSPNEEHKPLGKLHTSLDIMQPRTLSIAWCLNIAAERAKVVTWLKMLKNQWIDSLLWWVFTCIQIEVWETKYFMQIDKYTNTY